MKIYEVISRLEKIRATVYFTLLHATFMLVFSSSLLVYEFVDEKHYWLAVGKRGIGENNKLLLP